jgi:pro-kumamolisin-like protein/IPT/TIG domain-containing protein
MLGRREASCRAVLVRRVAVAVGWGIAAFAGTVCGATAWAAAPRLSAVGAAPAAVAGASYAGALAASSPLHLTVVLAPGDPAALASFVTGVSTPGSPIYGDYLAPGQFGPRFGATSQTIAAVSASLRAGGLAVGRASSDGLTIPVNGDAAAVGAALHVAFARYSLGGRRTGFANTSAPLLPAEVAGSVRDIVGLQTLSRPQALARPAALGAAGPAPCAAASAAASSQRAYTLDQLAEGYALDPFYGAGDGGAGTTVGIYELEPDLASDVAAFAACFGASTPVDVTPVDGGPGTGAGSGEAAIDIETVIGLAPLSRIEVFAGPDSGSGPLDIYVAMADQDTSQVNTTSWGLCEADVVIGDPRAIADETPVFEQMVAQGQTLYAATGDDGSEGCMGDVGTRSANALAVNDPASQTQVTGVGGTSLVATYSAGGTPTAVDATPLAMPPAQTVWNESALQAGAGGGGISTAHVMPSYQSGAPAALGVVNANSSGAPCGAPAGSDCREVPDVSAAADPVAGSEIYCTDDGTPDTICQGGHANGSAWEAVGGTSAAAPFWAGMTALINSDPAAGCAVPATFGLVNPLLYSIAAGPNHASALTDIAPPTGVGVPTGNDYGNHHAGLYPVAVGYDMATGLGTPLAGGPDGLAHQLCALRAPVDQAPSLSSLTPASGPASAGTAVTIDGAFFVPGATVAVGGSPASDVAVISFNQISAVLPAGSGPEPVTVTTPAGTSGPLTFAYPTPAPPPPPATTAPTTPGTTTPGTTTPGATGPLAPGSSPSLGPGTGSKPGGSAAPRSGPGAAALLLTCTGAKLAIVDVVESASRVDVSGAATLSLAGRRVRILVGTAKPGAGSRRREVGNAVVAASGLFSARVPLPSAALRRAGVGEVRYAAELGSLASTAVPLSRRLTLDPPHVSGGRVTLVGRVAAPLASPVAPIVVRQSASCAAGTQVASVHPQASGRFTVSLPEPPGVRAALYRLGTRVRQTLSSRGTVATASLLEPVALT